VSPRPMALRACMAACAYHQPLICALQNFVGSRRLEIGKDEKSEELRAEVGWRSNPRVGLMIAWTLCLPPRGGLSWESTACGSVVIIGLQ
jgi:hypothetical protein